MKQNFFAVDLGATSGRTILGTFIEGGLNLEEINRFPNHLVEVGGHFYWDIYALYRHILDGLKLVAHRGESIASIGIDTWGVDFVCVGKDGNLLRQGRESMLFISNSLDRFASWSVSASCFTW